MRLIDADALIEKTDDKYSLGEIGRRERDDIVDALEFAPTIEADRPKGEWIEHKTEVHGGYVNLSRCSECGVVGAFKTFDFCPNCGADMRGADDE